MLPESWFPYVFPSLLREDRSWLPAFGKNRRTYLLGFHHSAGTVARHQIDAIREGLNPPFKEDPRRYIPMTGWRAEFPHPGEDREPDVFYKQPPRELKHTKCSRWGQFGRDQPEHAWMKRPMRLYDALKCLAALHDAEEQLNVQRISPSADGMHHAPGQVSLHMAIFHLSNFTPEYFMAHFENDPALTDELYGACELRRHLHGVRTNTLFEMANGLSATARTCQTIKDFCAAKALPSVGSVEMDLSVRGTHRTLRGKVKGLRTGPFKLFSEDCAIEMFYT